MAAYYQTHGKSVYEALCDMYSRYGLYKEHTSNIYMEGIDGAERMKKLMSKLRSCPPEKIGEEKVRFIRDYLERLPTLKPEVRAVHICRNLMYCSMKWKAEIRS